MPIARFRHGFIIVKLRASINRDVERYIKQIALMEQTGPAGRPRGGGGGRGG